jgi:membrane protease YdiL (CAAX protease family)
VTSVAFAGIHLIPEFFPALLVFALGLLWLRRRTGGLVAPIVAHAVNNVAALFL